MDVEPQGPRHLVATTCSHLVKSRHDCTARPSPFSCRYFCQNSDKSFRLDPCACLGSLSPAQPRWRRQRITPEGLSRLRKCAHGITRRRLEPLHWDNCRITHNHAKAAGWALRRLREGFHEDDIARAYLRALRRAHGFAVDLEAEHGSFTMASTFAEASRILSCDNLPTGERVSRFYDRRHAESEALLAEIRKAQTSSAG